MTSPTDRLACRHPPKPGCRKCQLAGRVPFPPDMPPPAGWSPPPGSPAATGDWPEQTAPVAVLVVPDCPERGGPLPGQADVPCGARLRRCGIFDRCTTRVPIVEVACCATCDVPGSRLEVGPRGGG